MTLLQNFVKNITVTHLTVGETNQQRPTNNSDDGDSGRKEMDDSHPKNEPNKRMYSLGHLFVLFRLASYSRNLLRSIKLFQISFTKCRSPTLCKLCSAPPSMSTMYSI
jgi:hypothetical protein